MAARKILGRGNASRAQRISSGPARHRIFLALSGVAALAAALVAFSVSHAGAATGAAQGGVAESSLVYRLDTCLTSGQAKPTVVLVHGAWADASS